MSKFKLARFSPKLTRFLFQNLVCRDSEAR